MHFPCSYTVNTNLFLNICIYSWPKHVGVETNINIVQSAGIKTLCFRNYFILTVKFLLRYE